MTAPPAEAVVARAVAAIGAGAVVVLPTDTVYGLAATAGTPAGRDALYRLKGRDPGQPSALVAATVELVLESLPELGGRLERMIATLLPGPYTLVVPNSSRRFAWLCGNDPGSIGIRVPVLSGAVAAVLSAAGPVVATSANMPGGPDPRTVGDIPKVLRDGVAVVVDGGELPGIPSTVLDLTQPEPRVVRAGAGDVDAAIARLAALV